MRSVFRKYMTETVTREPYLGADEDGGRALYGSPETLAHVRVEPSAAVVRQSDGEEVKARRVLFCDSSNVLNAKDRITSQGDESLEVIAIDRLRDVRGGGIHHIEALLG